MPVLTVNTDNIVDIRAGIATLQAILASRTGVDSVPAAQTNTFTFASGLNNKVASLKAKGIWPFLANAARLDVDEFSLPELGAHLGMSSSKVCSLKAILRKPEKRLGIAFFEPAPSGSVDAAGNPRYRIVPEIKTAIVQA